MNKLKLSHVTTFDSSSQKAPKNVVKYSPEYEIALANLIIMLAPIAPHFASELWAKFLAIPNRAESKATDGQTSIDWTKDVLEQSWPVVSKNFQYWLDIKVKNLNVVASVHHLNRCTIGFCSYFQINKKTKTLRIPRAETGAMTKDFAMEQASQLDEFKRITATMTIQHVGFSHADGIYAVLSIIAEPKDGKKEKKKNKAKSEHTDDDNDKTSEMN